MRGTPYANRAQRRRVQCDLYEPWVWACVPSSCLRLLLARHSREAVDMVEATGVATGVAMAVGTEVVFTRVAGAASMLVVLGVEEVVGEHLALRCVRFGRQVAGVGAAACRSGSASAAL